MTKAGEKLLGAIEEARIVAACDHEWGEDPNPPLKAMTGEFDVTYCPKCKGRIFTPKPPS